MRRVWWICILWSSLVSCSENYALRYPGRAFPTQPGQRVVITTLRGRTVIRGVEGSRDIVIQGTIYTIAQSPEEADRAAQEVSVVDASIPAGPLPALRLDYRGISSISPTRFESQLLVPPDIRIEIRDGPEDLSVESLEAGITISDGAGDIALHRISGPVEIDDLDGDIHFIDGQGPVKILDRRGGIHIEEITGSVDITDREDDALIQSVTGDLRFSKRGRGIVRINNLDGKLDIREWDNPFPAQINTVWEKVGETARPVPSSGPPPPEGSSGEKKEPPAKK